MARRFVRPAWLWVLVLAVACGRGPGRGTAATGAPADRVGTGSQEAGGTDASVRFRFSAEPRAFYSTEAEPPSPAEPPFPGLVTDARLDRAAASISELSAAGLPITGSVAREALWWHGAPEAALELALFKDADSQALAERVNAWFRERQGRGADRIGLFVRPIPGGVEAVALAVESRLALKKVPRRLEAPGQTLRLEGAPRDPYRDVEVAVTAPDGKGVRPPVSREKQGRFRAAIRLDQVGIWQVELIGQGPGGPTGLANFPVAVGVWPHDAITLRSERLESSDPRDLEKRLFDAMNRDRQRAALAPAGWSDPLAEVARRYAEEMAETGIVAHRSRISGSVSDRLQAAGIARLGVSENLARASSAREAHEGLMGSPAHRANLLGPTVNEVGIGVAVVEADGETAILVVQIFALDPSADGRAVKAGDLVREINRLRKARQLQPLGQHPWLQQTAEQISARHAAGRAPAIPDFGDRFRAVKLVFVETANPLASAGSASAFLAPDVRCIGLAVLPCPGSGPKLLCVIALLGTDGRCP